MATLKLPLYGPARLELGDTTIKLNRPALSILYYLALEGPSRRERVADILWGDGAASTNLRGALHQLRKRLEQIGLVAFPKGQNPLRLPSFIVTDETVGEGEVLEGLEGLSSEFQGWLEWQRAKLDNSSPSPVVLRKQLVRETAQRVRTPYLILLEAAPDAGAEAFARALAAELGLPFATEPRGERSALRFLAAAQITVETIRHIKQDRTSLWVVERSSFGEEPRAFLELRAGFAHERSLYLKLTPLTWPEARDALLRELPFAAAAQLYLVSGGQPDGLAETLRHYYHVGAAALQRTPRRISALYQLEARFMNLEARFALEHLSVHPGTLSNALLEALGAGGQVEELERRGWLVFDEGWRFASETARRALYDTVQEGRLYRFHLQLADIFSTLDKPVLARFHLTMAGGLGLETAPPSPEFSESALPPNPPRITLEVLGSLPNPNGEADKVELVWSRTPLETTESCRTWSLPDEPCALHLCGRVWSEPVFGVPAMAAAWPLALEVDEARLRCGIILETSSRGLLESDYAVATVETLDLWFYAPYVRSLTLFSRAEQGVFELEASLYHVREVDGGVPSVGTVRAHALIEQGKTQTLPSWHQLE